MNIDKEVKKTFTEIEKSYEFLNINREIAGVFYTLYLRCKRTIYAITVLKNSKDENVNHIESMPLLRVLLEAYFHLAYVMSEKDTIKVKQGYEALTSFSLHSIGRKMKHSTELGVKGKEFVELHDGTYKLPKEFEFLNDPGSLAAKSGKRDLYRKHYSILNSFIHFNPAIFVNYGSFSDDKFLYNASNNTEEVSVFSLVDKLSFMIIAEIILFLGNEELEQQTSLLFKEYLEATVN